MGLFTQLGNAWNTVTEGYIDPAINYVTEYTAPIQRKVSWVTTPLIAGVVNFCEPAIRAALATGVARNLALLTKVISEDTAAVIGDITLATNLIFAFVSTIILTRTQLAQKKGYEDVSGQESEPQNLIENLPGSYKWIRRTLRASESVYAIFNLFEFSGFMLKFLLSPLGFAAAVTIALVASVVRNIADKNKPFLLTDPQPQEERRKISENQGRWELIKPNWKDYSAEAEKTLNMSLFFSQYLLGFLNKPSNSLYLSLRFSSVLLGSSLSAHSFSWAVNRDKNASDEKDTEHYNASKFRSFISNASLITRAGFGLYLLFAGIDHFKHPETSGDIPWLPFILISAVSAMIGGVMAGKIPRVVRAEPKKTSIIHEYDVDSTPGDDVENSYKTLPGFELNSTDPTYRPQTLPPPSSNDLNEPLLKNT